MNKEQLLTAIRSEIKEIEIKALGSGVYLRFRTLTGRARDAFHAAYATGDKAASHFEALIVGAAVVDEAGEPMFTPEEIETLRDQDAEALSAIAAAALQVNKIGVVAEEAAVKN